MVNFTEPVAMALPLPCPWTSRDGGGQHRQAGPIRHRRLPGRCGSARGVRWSHGADSDRLVTAGYVDLQFKP